jgi:IS5 family transposase
MGPKTPVPEQDFFRHPLREQINLKHPLVRLTDLINWERLGALMSESFVSGKGRPASSPRLIAGLLYLQHTFDLSDEEVVWQWVENPYWQVFTGETYLQTEPPIDPSSLTRWRKRLGEAGVEELLAKGKARKPYEFGVKVSITTTHKEGLVVGMRSMPGNPYDGHTLAEALEQTAILCDATPEVAIVDRGYKGVAVDGVKIYHPGLRRGITRGLRAMIRRRSAIEPAIGHMKTDGKLDRNWLKGALGDAMHAVLCGAGHNLRMILRKLRLLCVFILAVLFNRSVAAGVMA